MEKNRFISTEENVLLGSVAICKYLGIASNTTLMVWIEQYGLPVAKRPDGVWMTTVSAIDSWLFLAAGAESENRAYSRGTNLRADKALEMAIKRAERNKSKLVVEPSVQRSAGGVHSGPFFVKDRADEPATPQGNENGS